MTNEEMDSLDRWLAEKLYPLVEKINWHPTRNIAQAMEAANKVVDNKTWIRITLVHGEGYEISVFKAGIGKQTPFSLDNELWTDFSVDLEPLLSLAVKEAWEVECP